MIKNLLFVAFSLFATAICAQETYVVPSIDDITGDYMVMNYQTYNNVKGLATTKGIKIDKVNETTIKISGFYVNKCLDFNADYDTTTGTISIPAATPIYDMGNYMVNLCPWNDEDGEPINRPIEYKYDGNDSWFCTTTIMLVPTQEGVQLSPFSEGSKIVKCNGTSNVVSYYGVGDNQEEYNDANASYVVIDGNYIDIYNLRQADQYGYGINVSGIYDKDLKEAFFNSAVIGMANDGTYKVLTGCEYDEETNLPTGMTFPDTDYMGLTKASIDFEKGEISFEPMAIWAATLDQNTGKLTVNEDVLFEFVKCANVTFDVDKAIEANIETVNSIKKEIEKVEFYTIDGMKVEKPEHGTFIIKRTVYKDNTVNSEKIIY